MGKNPGILVMPSVFFEIEDCARTSSTKVRERRIKAIRLIMLSFQSAISAKRSYTGSMWFRVFAGALLLSGLALAQPSCPPTAVYSACELVFDLDNAEAK